MVHTKSCRCSWSLRCPLFNLVHCRQLPGFRNRKIASPRRSTEGSPSLPSLLQQPVSPAGSIFFRMHFAASSRTLRRSHASWIYFHHLYFTIKEFIDEFLLCVHIGAVVFPSLKRQGLDPNTPITIAPFPTSSSSPNS